MFTQEEFERWLAGLPAGLHDPTLRNATLVAPTILGGTLVAPTILGATLDSPTITGIPTAPSAVPVQS